MNRIARVVTVLLLLLVVPESAATEPLTDLGLTAYEGGGLVTAPSTSAWWTTTTTTDQAAGGTYSSRGRAGEVMAASGGPRIGRPDRLAALASGTYAPQPVLGPPPAPVAVESRRVGVLSRSAVSRLLARPAPTIDPPTPPIEPPAPPKPPAWREVRERAQQLAEQLTPLPNALNEIATRIRRHCAVAGRDDELAGVVDAIRQRTWALMLAVDRLAEVAKRDSS